MIEERRPADRLVGVELKDGWKVLEVYKPPFGDPLDTRYNSCYLVQKGKAKGFLKAFDYNDIRLAGGHDQYKRLEYRYMTELKMLQKCQSKGIPAVINLLAVGRHNPDNLNELVEYFILEYSGDGNVHDCLERGNLQQFTARFKALQDVFDGLNSLHSNGIMHLDLKAENVIHFVTGRLTKITDFGSARQFINDLDEDLLEEVDKITTTRHYAPPEFLYFDFWTSDWIKYRRKVDLFLAGNLIVKLFTGFSFTALLREAITSTYDWNNPQNVAKGRYQQLLPHLISAAADVYLVIKKKLRVINEECGRPLADDNINDLVKIISELCTPDASKRGHPKVQYQKNDSDGLDRYRDKFITLRNLCEVRESQRKS